MAEWHLEVGSGYGLENGYITFDNEEDFLEYVDKYEEFIDQVLYIDDNGQEHLYGVAYDYEERRDYLDLETDLIRQREMEEHEAHMEWVQEPSFFLRDFYSETEREDVEYDDDIPF